MACDINCSNQGTELILNMGYIYFLYFTGNY